ncbi:MAG: hypothetical protein EAZ97_02720 [Bacteroidetes bacterium]|nr:MAG: hypothetical protein EAZ97_02720 [Bacteroidota bacterium]
MGDKRIIIMNKSKVLPTIGMFICFLVTAQYIIPIFTEVSSPPIWVNAIIAFVCALGWKFSMEKWGNFQKKNNS